MTLTKKSLAFAMALLMVLPLALLALPLTAEAAPGGAPTITAVYPMGGNKVRIEYTPHSGDVASSTKYSVLPASGNGTSGPGYFEWTFAGTGSRSVQVRATDNGTADSNSVTIDPNVPTMPVYWSVGAGLDYDTYKTTGNGTTVSGTGRPTGAFYNGTQEVTFKYRSGVFQSPLHTTASGASIATNGTVITASSMKPGAIIRVGGGTYVPGTGGGYSPYDDVYTALGEHTYYGKGDLTYNINAPKHKLEKVGVNRQLLTEGKHYTVSADGPHRTNITLKESFLNTLPLGYNRFSFSFADGTSHVEIRVRETGSSGGSVGSGNATALRSLTVYNKASTKGKKLGTYAKGADIRVTGYTSSGTYAMVEFGGETGYVRAEYINASLADSMTARTSGSSTSLYTRKSTSSKYRYAKVSRNTELTLLAREGSYWKVSFNGEDLYVRAKDVKDLTVG